MSDNKAQIYTKIIKSAVANKYSDEFVGLEERISGLLSTLTNLEAAELLGAVRSLEKPEDDINNQVVVLELIERHWSRTDVMPCPLQILHACLSGRFGETEFRRSEFVEDYGGIVPTKSLEISQRLDELERLCKHVIVSLADCDVSSKASMLAYIYSGVIRIHPFADGNGRVARMFVYYALGSWGLKLFPIPKVRNDEEWKAALKSGEAGEFERLRSFFKQRMSQEQSTL